MTKTKIEESADADSSISALCERDRREFENHWLWRELGTTPRDFFAAVDAYVSASGIPRAEWDAKVLKAKCDIESRVREERLPKRPFSYALLAGLKA